MLTKEFLKKVLAGEKKLMMKKDLLPIEVPGYDEISSKQLWPLMQGDEEFLKYFPDNLPEGKFPCKSYFHNILHTLHPVYTNNIIMHAHQKRHGGEAAAEKEEAIEVTDEWMEVLKAMPYNSSKYNNIVVLTILVEKAGKTIHLLKKKSKVRVGGQKRRKVALIYSFEEYKKQKDQAAQAEALRRSF